MVVEAAYRAVVGKKEPEFEFKMETALGRTIYIFSDEEIAVQEGNVYKIRIKPIKIPKNHIVLTCNYVINDLGKAIGIGERSPRPVEVNREGTYALFATMKSGTIKEGALIGATVMVKVAVQS
jgi:hypothetical protein